MNCDLWASIWNYNLELKKIDLKIFEIQFQFSKFLVCIFTTNVKVVRNLGTVTFDSLIVFTATVFKVKIVKKNINCLEHLIKENPFLNFKGLQVDFLCIVKK